MNKAKSVEIEARFLEIDSQKLKERLSQLKSKDLKETLLKETIFYDKSLSWRDQHKLVRLRKVNDIVYLTYKHRTESTIDGTEEVEVEVSDYETAKELLKKTGLVAYREQEKRRHSFILDDVHLDIDTWPSIPTYLEIEGNSPEEIKAVAQKLNLDWDTAVFEDARAIIENHYHIPVSQMHTFTFTKFE